MDGTAPVSGGIKLPGFFLVKNCRTKIRIILWCNVGGLGGWVVMKRLVKHTEPCAVEMSGEASGCLRSKES